MAGTYTKAITALFKMARQNVEYAKMNEEYKELENQFSDMVMGLPQEQQDLAWEFICHSEAMNWKMLEIICEKMQALFCDGE